MATVQKFYLLDATSPNTGTMPSGDWLLAPHLGAGTDATGFATARDANTPQGASNPDIDATGTAAATTAAQRLCLRRFVSRPLAARTMAAADGNWTWSIGCGESNTNHNGTLHCRMYLWRPSTGLRVGTAAINLSSSTAMSTTAEQIVTDTTGGTVQWSGSQAILDGDIIVFEVGDEFTQAMGTAYTTFFSYNGTTEASTTTAASFVNAPAALTLFTAPVTASMPPSQRTARNFLLRR